MRRKYEPQLLSEYLTNNPKNCWNDTRPNCVAYTIVCASCRCTTAITVTHYPHGPRQLKSCPVCGTADESNLVIKEG